jgi:hypothetical protein
MAARLYCVAAFTSLYQPPSAPSAAQAAISVEQLSAAQVRQSAVGTAPVAAFAQRSEHAALVLASAPASAESSQRPPPSTPAPVRGFVLQTQSRSALRIGTLDAQGLPAARPDWSVAEQTAHDPESVVVPLSCGPESVVTLVSVPLSVPPTLLSPLLLLHAANEALMAPRPIKPKAKKILRM